MSSQNISPESWIGKLVWVFLRDEAGLPISVRADCGIVVDSEECTLGAVGTMYVVQVEDNYYRVWDEDMELVEDWDENLEREISQVEEP